MKKHIAQIHEGEKPEKIQCSICEKLFTSKRSLKEHTAVVHDDKKPFKCDSCDISCATKSKLKRHIRMVHERLRTSQCSFCGKTFKSISNLKEECAEGVLKKSDFGMYS